MTTAIYFSISKLREICLLFFTENALTRNDESEASHPSFCLVICKVQQTMHSCVDNYQVICISHQSICGSGLHYARGDFGEKKHRSTKRKDPASIPSHRDLRRIPFSLVLCKCEVQKYAWEKRCVCAQQDQRWGTSGVWFVPIRPVTIKRVEGRTRRR